MLTKEQLERELERVDIRVKQLEQALKGLCFCCVNAKPRPLWCEYAATDGGRQCKHWHFNEEWAGEKSDSYEAKCFQSK